MPRSRRYQSRALGFAIAAVTTALLAGCGASLQSANVSATASSQATSADGAQNATVSRVAAASTNPAKPFNPFAEDGDATLGGPRVVIKNPTLAQVLQPGPLDEIALGSKSAPVTVIKYFSPTCPFCRQFQRKVFPQFKRTYIDTGRVRFIMREFPIGFQSGAATIAIRCAPANRRVGLYEALLNNQARWVSQDVRREPIFNIARMHGVTRTAFDACFSDKTLVADLKTVKDRGRTLGIIGTPNFFINNTLHKRVLSMNDFRTLIDGETAVTAQATSARR